MTGERERDLIAKLRVGLVRLLIQRVKAENAAHLAEAFMEDLGYEDCPVCVANRRRAAFSQ